MTEAKVAHVFKAMGEVLKSLSVAKGGTLPGNMGGAPYIRAEDVAIETKRLFVEHGLILLPAESVVRTETVINKDRVNILTQVSGTYEIVSTVDGSSVKVTGTGDGIAMATAVSSNIASTNAFKNALLRTFMITESSVEDMTHNGVEPAGREAPAALVPKAVSRAVGAEKAAQDAIRDEFIEAGKVSRDEVNTLFLAAKESGSKTPFADVLAQLKVA